MRDAAEHRLYLYCAMYLKLPYYKCNLYSTLDIMEKMLQKTRLLVFNVAENVSKALLYLLFSRSSHEKVSMYCTCSLQYITYIPTVIQKGM